MQSKINKFLFFIILLLILIFILIFVYDQFNNKEKEYSINFSYLNTYIYLKIYCDDADKANQIFSDIKDIYAKYDQLVDNYNEYENINNLYYINYNNDNSEYILLDKDLYNLIQYGIDVYKTSNQLIDISKGNVIDIWESYIKSKYGVPTLEELKSVYNTSNIQDIKLTNDYKILNNHVNINLNYIVKGYVTNIIGEYLTKNKIKKYIINTGNVILVGDNFDNNKYSIGLEVNNKIFKIIYANNMSVSTTSIYDKYYEWNKIKYNSVIDLKTLFPSNNMQSVTVITKDSKLSDKLSKMLFLMNIEDGKKYIESLNNVEAVWYTNDNNIITTSNINKYE
ncbi:MAG: FAD:protein FMN transferase [Bacilli bacterium]|nr:FAD:protein FMN transferase [Bacilli bacterium]